jgi:hypothetical protein
VKLYDLNEFPVFANISSSTNFIILDNGTQLKQAVASGGSVTTVIDYQVNEWVDIVITRDGDVNTTVYFNGVAQARALAADVDLSLREVGRRSTAAYGKGEIADIRIYDYALPASEAQDYHNQFAKQVHQQLALEDFGVGSTI